MADSQPVFTYRAELLKVIDGDTVDVRLDLGFKIWHDVRLRLSGLNCPERGTPAGAEASAFTRDWFVSAEGKGDEPVVVTTMKDRTEKYGRYLATVMDLGQTRCLNNDLLIAQHAVAYDGGKR